MPTPIGLSSPTINSSLNAGLALSWGGPHPYLTYEFFGCEPGSPRDAVVHSFTAYIRESQFSGIILHHIFLVIFFAISFHLLLFAMISSMNFFGALLSVLAISQHVSAVPTPRNLDCSTSADVLDLSPWQTQLFVPPGEKPAYVTVGAGFQNYTCSSTTGLYT